MGLIITADVRNARIQDLDSSLNLFTQPTKNPTLCKFFANQGYTDKLQNLCLLEIECLLTIAKKLVDAGSKVIPKRWIVKRTLA